ncbi:MAG TPA: phospholipid carrier-dependent glycosyltransferase [Polyangia bacterium]|jgi:dolichyl-phosphate-mannose--protein O-mannosyl transferase
MRSVRDDLPLAVVLAFMFAVGVLLRVYRLEVPNALKWDEHHYVGVARSYLAHQYNTDDHPPLGKLIITGVMVFFGDTPLGWRLASLIFGFLNIGLIAWTTRVAFKSWRAAFIAAAFVAVDGFFIAYSRAALLDGMIVAFAMAGVATILTAQRLWQVLLAGVFVGCAASFKLNGVTFVAVALVICAAARRTRLFTPLLAVVSAVVFYVQAAFPLILTGGSGSLAAVIAENKKLIKHHLSYTVVNPSSSHWYTWFLPLRPIFLRRDIDPVDGSIHALLTLGNPLLWWASTLAVVAATVVVVRTGRRRLWQQLLGARVDAGPTGGTDVLAVQDRAGLLFGLLMAWAAPLAFWVPSLRDAYLYHYLPSYTFALVLLAGFADRFYARRQLATFIAIVLVLEVSIFYAPLWGELSISQEALNARLFPNWR